MSGRPDDPDDDATAHRSYASPACYAHEFEAAAPGLPPRVYRAIVEQAAEAIVVADREGTICLWNRGAQRVFGFSESEALGANLDLIIPERLRAAHWEAYGRAFETGRLRAPGKARVTRSQHRDGRKLYVEMSFGLALDDAGAVLGAFAIARDCTDRVAAGSTPRAPEAPAGQGR
ncbi:MAG TPA: PAS domain S-box protein [Burkholderiaceae bacterium]|nr:PAS domain S-box protein [Burkholderiaceae bacterium]